MKVFWSWQNDLDAERHRAFIKKCLQQAVADAGRELGLEDADRPELDHDTKNERGMVDIASTILRKITESAIFVADVTPIGRAANGKALPNPNVLIELGWALHKPGFERVIAVFNAANGSKAEDLPFDIRHRRAMQYDLPAGADKATTEKVRKKLVRELTDAIRTNLGEHIETIATSQDLMKVPADPADPSIWATAGKTFTHHDSLGRDHQTTVALTGGPRAFIRIIPGGWTSGAPSVHDIHRLRDELAVWPPAENGSSGDFGACEEGYIHYWMTGATGDGGRESANVACFFDETGEFWIIHGTAIIDGKLGKTLHPGRVLGGWSKAIRQAFAVFDRFGALQARRVELGLVGVKGVRWAGGWERDSPPARKDRFILDRQSRDWSEAAEIAFLTEAYSGVKDLFGAPRAQEAEVQKILAEWDAGRAADARAKVAKKAG
jgi:hypothetical protein